WRAFERPEFLLQRRHASAHAPRGSIARQRLRASARSSLRRKELRVRVSLASTTLVTHSTQSCLQLLPLWLKVCEAKGVKFYGLRHFPVTPLLRRLPVHVVSARAASITLDAYAYLIGGEDAAAAKAAEESLRRALK